MSNKSPILLSAVSSLLVLGMAAGAPAVAADSEMEKCFGVVKAGKNDCQTANSSCAGTSTVYGQGDAWVFVPKGTCEKIVGGSTEAKT